MTFRVNIRSKFHQENLLFRFRFLNVSDDPPVQPLQQLKSNVPSLCPYCCVYAAFRLRFAGSYEHLSWYGPAGETRLDRNQLERLSWTGTSYIVRDRYSTDRV